MSEDREGSLDGLSREAADALAAAKAEAALAEAKKLRFEAETAEMVAKASRIDLDRALEEEAKRKTANFYAHILDFDAVVTDSTVKAAEQTLDTWSRLEPGCDITIRFMSPGGDVIAGMAFFDYLMCLRNRGHKITCEAVGYAASMAGILLQAGTVRRCGAESYILIHEISTAVRGKVGEIEDEMVFIKKLSDRVLNIFAERSKEAGDAGTAKHPLKKSGFKSRWERRDWWLTSAEALDFGVVDEVTP